MIVFCAKLLQLCLTLCDPMDCTCQDPLSVGFSRQECWSGFFSRGSSRPRVQTCVSFISWDGWQVLYQQCHLGSPEPMTFYFTLFSESFTALGREVCALSSQVCGQDLGKGNRCFIINCSSLSGGSRFKVRLSVLSTGL